MMLIDSVQDFLKKKFTELKIERKIFANESDIPYSTITHILQGLNINPSTITIIKIANYFQCYVDEVVGRNEYLELSKCNILNQKITIDSINTNIKNFLSDKGINNNINLRKLSRDIGLSYNTLYNFFYSKRNQKNLNIQTIIKIADYFKVSTDEAIGRINYINN